MSAFASPAALRAQRAAPCAARVAVCSATAKKEEKKKRATIELTDAEAAGWAAVRAQLRALGGKLDSDKAADRAVMRAFGWGGSKYWRGAVVRETPAPDVVAERLCYLRDTLGFDDDQVIARMVAKFPELIRLPLDRIQQNINHIRTTYPVLSREAALRDSLASQPAAFGFDVDCSGDCMSECSRCWVRFE